MHLLLLHVNHVRCVLTGNKVNQNLHAVMDTDYAIQSLLTTPQFTVLHYATPTIVGNDKSHRNPIWLELAPVKNSLLCCWRISTYETIVPFPADVNAISYGENKLCSLPICLKIAGNLLPIQAFSLFYYTWTVYVHGSKNSNAQGEMLTSFESLRGLTVD